MSWFHFSFPDFAFAFLSVLLEGVPFLIFGTLLSGLIDEFVPSKAMMKLLPRNPVMGVALSGVMGLVFPMCECGIVPVIRRLLAKGLPLSNAVTYMLAAPIVNPIVVLSTYTAFRGQHPVEITLLRLAVGYLVAVIVGLAVNQLPQRSILLPGIISAPVSEPATEDRQARLHVRLGRALRVATGDFLDLMIYFVLGVAISSCFSTAVDRQAVDSLALNIWLSTGSLMIFSAVLSLCSTSDAFIAATLLAFPVAAKLAFLVYGPMLDLKLIFIYSAVFRKRFVLGLAVGLFILVGLICIRLDVIKL